MLEDSQCCGVAPRTLASTVTATRATLLSAVPPNAGSSSALCFGLKLPASDGAAPPGCAKKSVAALAAALAILTSRPWLSTFGCRPPRKTADRQTYRNERRCLRQHDRQIAIKKTLSLRQWKPF